jgi:hypothetical protein
MSIVVGGLFRMGYREHANGAMDPVRREAERAADEADPEQVFLGGWSRIAHGPR